MGNSTEQSTIDEFQASSLALEDAALFRRCKSGDQAAWNELVDRYQRLIYSIPRRGGLSDEESSDIFQDVFVTLLQKLDEIKQPEKIRAWLVTTAKFKTWGVIRSRKNEVADGDPEKHELLMANEPDLRPLADTVLIEMEQQHLIRTAIASMDERCRTILSMLYLQDKPASYEEVGEVIGAGGTSISPLRSRCLKKLEKLITN